MSKNREQKHAHHLAEKHAHEQQRHEEEAAHHEEHFVEAPKGTSRARFLFNFLLVVFLLVIFSISGPFMSALSGRGGGADDVFCSWTLPNGERRSLSTIEFFQEKRHFASLEVMFPYLGMQGIDPGEDESTARFLISEDMAEWNGVSAASEDLAELILGAFGDQETYRSYIASRRDLTPADFEKILRRGRTVQRFTQLLASGAHLVSPKEIAETWTKQNQEYDLQYVELVNADFAEAARAELPGAEELQDWFDGLSPFEKSRFNTLPSWSADVVWFDTAAPVDTTALFAKYPRPEDEDAEEMALNYYNSFSYVRFARPEPEEGQEESAEKFFSFDEVADAARLEAPVYYSMADWLSDMQSRMDAGEAVDLEAEGKALGLSATLVAPRSREAWSEGEEPWSGQFLAQSTSSVPEGRLATRVTVEEGALVVARVLEKQDPSLPPFEEIREKVADRWVEQNQSEVALENLRKLRAQFEAAPAEGVEEASKEAKADLEAFKAAVTAAGYTLVERGYRSRYPRPGDDSSELTSGDTYLQGSSLIYSLADSDIAEPEASRDGLNSFLVRFGGKRDADLSKMDPSELQAMQGQLGRNAEVAFFQDSFDDPEWIKRNFSLYLKSWDDTTASN
jgi:hypothetical protein